MKNILLKILMTLAALAIAAGAWAQSRSTAQTFPWKLVKIDAPYSSGAAPAVFTRLVADKLTKIWGQQVIVDSKPGASGFIAIDAVKAAPPDGHELLVIANSHMAINPALYKKLPYDPQKDFVPVANFYLTTFFITVKSDGPYPTVRALIDAAKVKPGAISYSSSYVGSPSHLGSAAFEFATGTKMIHAPYKDQSQMYVAIANGDIDWAFSTLGSALPLVKAGRIKLIAIGAKHRMKTLPDIPTVEEAAGLAGFQVDTWLGLAAPRATPPETVHRINNDVKRVLADPDVLARMETFGFEPAPMTPEQFAEMIRADTKRYADLVKRTGATAD